MTVFVQVLLRKKLSCIVGYYIFAGDMSRARNFSTIMITLLLQVLFSVRVLVVEDVIRLNLVAIQSGHSAMGSFGSSLSVKVGVLFIIE